MKRSKAPSSRSVTTKKLIVDEYRRRLKTGAQSLSLNLSSILNGAKITDDGVRNQTPTGLMAEHYTLSNEVCGRAALMARAADDLLKLTNDIREFLILRDFSFISRAMDKSIENETNEKRKVNEIYEKFRSELAAVCMDADRELNDNFALKH